jgi:hypothetical protein
MPGANLQVSGAGDEGLPIPQDMALLESINQLIN